ncbi:MAG: hypothetical protein WC523_04130 [Patescibacteria group bacterium]
MCKKIETKMSVSRVDTFVETKFACETPGCGFESESAITVNEHEFIKHEMKAHTVINGNIDFYWFDNEKDMNNLIEHGLYGKLYEQCTGCFSGPGWYGVMEDLNQKTVGETQ